MIKQLKLRPFTTSEYKPSGWLKRQLEIQAEGLSGNLDKFWPDIAQSKWIGGDRDGWERVPYWLDGFIPLAYLLDNKDMQKRAKRYVDAILANQCEDGWICPCNNDQRGGYDVWAAFLIAKVLTVWADCSGDADRIEKALIKMFYHLHSHISNHQLFVWARFRWYECLIPIYWVYERTHDEHLMGLAYELKSQGFDYFNMYRHFEDTRFVPNPKTCGLENHVVNTAMAVKSDVVYSLFDGVSSAVVDADNMLSKLDRYHGTATGIFTGDEHLDGKDPIHGTELCAVAEFMYSLEWLTFVTGDTKYLDRLERVTFNNYPATFTPDMWAHQYDQQANQVLCETIDWDKKPFVSNNGEAHIFGLEPHFGCCTANLSQAWPKFALSAFMHNDRDIYAAALVPGEVCYNGLTIKCITDYPFKNSIKYIVTADKSTTAAFYIRIPAWAQSASLDGKQIASGEWAKAGECFEGETEIVLTFTPALQFIPRNNGMTAISRGALVYSIKVDYELKQRQYGDGDLRVYPHCDYDVLPKSDFAYKLISRDIRFEEREIGTYPFDDRQPPVVAYAQAQPIDWRIGENKCLRLTPESLEPIGDTREIELVPYGTSMLRVTEFPITN